MSEYEIGRDIQELKSRIERLERSVGDDSIAQRGAGAAAAHRTHQSIGTKHPPIAWKAEKRVHLPPFIHGILGLPLGRGPQLDIQPESKTWASNLEPLILFVVWDAGGEDEFYRLWNQSFSIVKYYDPALEQPFLAQATYSATLTASGKAASQGIYPISRPGGSIHYTSQLLVILRNAQGAALSSFFGPHYSILCRDNYPVTWTWRFDQALYDSIDGATWTVEGDQRVDRC